MARKVDTDVALHRAGAAVLDALRWLGEAADALDADRCRELLCLGDFRCQGAVSGYFAGPPRVLAFRLPGAVPRYCASWEPEAGTQYRRLRAAAQVALRQALERGLTSGAVPRGLEEFGPGSLLVVDYGVSPEGGPLDVDNVWINVISDSFRALGLVPDDCCLGLHIRHRAVGPGESYTVAALVGEGANEESLASLRRLVELALSAHNTSQ